MKRSIFDVCLFFYVKGKFLISGCMLKDAEVYGDFMVYPDSHWEVWDKLYYEKMGVDFDFFPRGRVAYNVLEKKYYVYFDTCIQEQIKEFAEMYYSGEANLVTDEHYQCHNCNQGYVV